MRISVRSRASRGGFTLIELSIVVVVVGILATLGIAGYRRWITTSKTAEATQMLSGISNAQYSYKAQTGGFANVSSNINSYYPQNTTGVANAPSASKTQWGGSCTVCGTLDWNSLGVVATAPVYYGYATVAHDATMTPTAAGVTVNRYSDGTLIAFPVQTPAQPWFIARAAADLDGNGKFGSVITSSFSTDMLVDNEGE